MLVAESPQAEQHQLTDSYFDAEILTRIKLYNDRVTWMVPLRTLVGPCFKFYNKDYTNSTNDKMHTDDKIACIVEPMENIETRSQQLANCDLKILSV